MSFVIMHCDSELTYYLQILVNTHGQFAQGMLGVPDMITQITFSNIIDEQTYFTQKLLVGKQY